MDPSSRLSNIASGKLIIILEMEHKRAYEASSSFLKEFSKLVGLISQIMKHTCLIAFDMDGIFLTREDISYAHYFITKLTRQGHKIVLLAVVRRGIN